MTDREEASEAVIKMKATMDRYLTEESNSRGADFKPGSTDVIISTALKSGTTITQQICHGLRSRGDMSFKEIDEVFPCLETAYDRGYKDLYVPQSFEPRMYKTHFGGVHTPKGAGKYIVVVRKPADAALSLYHFMEDWFFKKGEVSMEEFAKWVWSDWGVHIAPSQLGNAVDHIASWYPHRLDKNVLWLHYEDLNKHRRECVRLISEFLNIGADDEELQELVTEQSSFAFMKKHCTRFDDHPIKHARNEAVGLPRDAGLTGNAGKVRNGISNSAKDVLPQSVIDQIDAQWNEVVTSVTGYKSYEEFRNGINKELNRIFN
eukprot:g5054.t1